MDTENEILKKVSETGLSRLEVIAGMNLGERSEAARRALYNRERRKELMEAGMSFKDACLVVNMENRQENESF